MPRILVVGAGGMLGGALRRRLALRLPDAEVVAPGRDRLDLCDPPSVASTVSRVRPDWIFNTAAYTGVDDAETEYEKALAVNGTGAGLLARAAAENDSLLIHVSTDYVFDGTKVSPYFEDDPPAPLGAYGRSKLEGEQQVLDSDSRSAIVRTAWLYGAGGKNFVDTMRRLFAEKPSLEVVNDQRGSPTWSDDLADALITLAHGGHTGITHATNSESCSWFELAVEIGKRIGSDVPVKPVDSNTFRRPAPRPANSVLDCGRYVTLTGRSLRPWSQALGDYLASCPDS